MRIRRAGRTFSAALGCTALVAGLVTGCGSAGGASAASGGKTTLTIDLFGTFGYKEAGLFTEYERLHPDITIKETDTENEADYWKALQTHLAAGSGLADIQGVEVGRIATVVRQEASDFTDLNSLGAASVTGNFLPWKAKAATTSSGAVLGLGTDTGPEAICYRSDLLKQAGLPTDRDTLAHRWSSWQGYLDLGEQYQAHAPAHSAWTDSVTGLFTAMTGQQAVRYYDQSGKPVYASNPLVKSAWQTSVEAARQRITARLTQWSPQWNQAFSTGAFATLPCPAWMTGYIKGQAGAAGKGRWDIAPGPGRTGNWGGSYLAVPKASKHRKQAYDLIAWLTAMDQQRKLFEKVGSFPSNTQAIASVRDYTDPYFNNAPVGAIFGESARNMPVQVLGVHDGDVGNQLTNGLSEVEQKGVPAQKAWQDAMDNIKNAVAQ